MWSCGGDAIRTRRYIFGIRAELPPDARAVQPTAS